MSRQARVHRLAASGPDDVLALTRALDEGQIDPRAIVAIFGKTEGNGNVNDWTRALATRALVDLIAERTDRDAAARICMVMSGGTEGGLSPHWIVLEAIEAGGPAVPAALAIGSAHTGPLAAEHLGRLAQVDAVAAGVRRAMVQAGIADAAGVDLVQIKCPLLTSERVAAATARGAATVTGDTLKSMAFSRAASALGVGVALGELPRAAIAEEAIGQDTALFCTRASASAGVELLGHEIVVLGRGTGWSGPLRIAHAVMADAIDVEPVRQALGRLGLSGSGHQLEAGSRGRLVALIAKAEAGASGGIRGSRHTMLTDSDISSTRHARAFVGGALAGLMGLTELFVSGGAEHQGPDGGGPVAIIAHAAEGNRP